MNMVWKYVNTAHTRVRANLCSYYGVEQRLFSYWTFMAAAAEADQHQYAKEIPLTVHEVILDHLEFFEPFVLNQGYFWSEDLKNNGPKLRDQIKQGRHFLHDCWDLLPVVCLPPKGHSQFSPAHLARLGLASQIMYLGGFSKDDISISHAQLMVIDMLIAFHCLYDALEYVYLGETDDPLIQQHVGMTSQLRNGTHEIKTGPCARIPIEQTETLKIIGYEAAKRAFAGEKLDPLLQLIADRSIFWVSSGEFRISASESDTLALIRAEAEVQEQAQDGHGQLDSLLKQFLGLSNWRSADSMF